MGVVAGDTCHVDVDRPLGQHGLGDAERRLAASSPVIPELGFCLGTRLQMFWLEEGLPSSLAPGKRPRSTLSPTLAFKDGEPYMAFGTPGGDGQDQWSPLLFLHHVHHGMNLQEAIDCPAFHTEHMPSSFYPRAAKPGLLALEGRFPEATCAALARRGHRVRVGEAWSGGRLSACAREETPEGTILKAGRQPARHAELRRRAVSDEQLENACEGKPGRRVNRLKWTSVNRRRLGYATMRYS